MTSIVIQLVLLAACSTYADVSHLGYKYEAPAHPLEIGISLARPNINIPSQSAYNYKEPITVDLPQNSYIPPGNNESPEDVYGPSEIYKPQRNTYETLTHNQEQQQKDYTSLEHVYSGPQMNYQEQRQQHDYAPLGPVYRRPLAKGPQKSYVSEEFLNQPSPNLGYKYEAPDEPANIDIPAINTIHPTTSDSGYKFNIPARPDDSYIPPQPISSPQNIYVNPRPISEPQNIYIPPETRQTPQNTYVPPGPQYEVVEVLTPEGYKTVHRLKTL